jgi:chemotaxis protein MotA
MTRDEFVKKYTEIVGLALKYSEKARREGLLAIEDELDHEKIKDRDVFEYGMSFVVDGVDAEIIEGILSNIIQQEKDEYMSILKKIQGVAVIGIQEGRNPRLLYAVLNSLTDLTLKEDEMSKLIED